MRSSPTGALSATRPSPGHSKDRAALLPSHRPVKSRLPQAPSHPGPSLPLLSSRARRYAHPTHTRILTFRAPTRQTRGAAADRHSRAQLRSAPHAALRQRALRPARRRQLQRRSRGGAVCLKIETPPLRLSLPSRFSPPTTFIKFSSLIHACSRADVTFFFPPLLEKEP